MGIINLKWHKACAVRGIGFTKEEQAAGWPESFALRRLAILQSPADNKMANILHRALIDACAAGSLPNAPTTVRQIAHEQRTVLAPVGFARRNIYGERELDYRTQMVPVMKAVEVPAVTAADFAAWLAAQGEKPSEHIAAWFDAVGVDTDNRPIEPPAGWQARTQHGLLRFNGTDTGRLVRMADLVAWIMENRELPCKAAVELVCTALERNPRAGAELYLLRESDYARPLPASHSFYYLPTETTPAEYLGIVGAVRCMRDYWAESTAPSAGKWHGQDVLDPLCIRLDVAFQLWGYGRRVDEVTQDDVPAVVSGMAAKESKEASVIKKSVLVQRHNRKWPTIDKDLSEASRNGLATVAASGRHGYWNEDAALKWAEERGKLTKPQSMDALSSTIHRMRG